MKSRGAARIGRAWRAVTVGGASTLVVGSLALAVATPDARAATCGLKCFAAQIGPANISVGATPTTVTFSMVITNEALNQQLGSANIAAPSGITLRTASAPTTGTATISGNVLQLRNIAVQPRRSSTFSFTATVPSPPTSTPVVYTWAVSAKQSNDYNGTGNDFILDSSTSALKTTVTRTPSTDLSVAFGAGSTPADQPDPVTPGNDVLYTITVTNNGPLDEGSVSLVSAVTGGSTIGQIPASGSGAGWSCSLADATDVTCSYGSLVSGASTVLQMWVHGPSTAPTAPINCGTASVTAICDTVNVSGSQPESASGNNSAAESTTVASTICPPTDTTCGRSFINFSTPSSVTSGSAANAANWLVGTQNFPATSSTGGQLFGLDALQAPGAFCPLTATGGIGTLTTCTFELDTDVNPSQYTGKNITLNLECDQSHCPVASVGSGGFVMVKVADGSNSPQLLSRCNSSNPTTPCYSTSVSSSNGNFQVTLTGITPGDPRYAGKCYVDCTPALP